MSRISCLVATCLLAITVESASATQYLVNGSFEAGNFSNWTIAAVSPTIQPNSFGIGAEDGNFYGTTDPHGGLQTFLTQDFLDTPGQTLLVSGWVAGVGTNPASVDFKFGSANTFSLFNRPTVLSINPSAGSAYIFYSATVVASGFDAFELLFQGNAQQSNTVAFDNFSVSTVDTTPLPASLPPSRYSPPASA